MPPLRRLLATARLDAAGRRDLEAAAGDAVCVYVSPDRAGALKRALAIACENLRHYRADAPLLNELGPEDVYSHARDEHPRGFSSRALVARVRSAKRRLAR